MEAARVALLCLLGTGVGVAPWCLPAVFSLPGIARMSTLAMPPSDRMPPMPGAAKPELLQRLPGRFSSGAIGARGAFLAVVATAVFAASRHRRSATVRSASEDMKGQFDWNKYYDAVPDKATRGWVMQQTMFRIKEPRRSLDFYTKVLGMRLIAVGNFPQWGFTVFFVGYPTDKDLGPIPEDDKEKFAYCMQVPGCIELTWNHGTEAEAQNRVYNTGNSDGTGVPEGVSVKGGFGHIGITVPDVYAACERFKDMGVEFHKSPNSGGMKGLAFIKDPDGYLVEVLPLGKASPFPTQEVDCLGVTLSGGGGYKDNSKK